MSETHICYRENCIPFYEYSQLFYISQNLSLPYQKSVQYEMSCPFYWNMFLWSEHILQL